jgi:hypothetical protein
MIIRCNCFGNTVVFALLLLVCGAGRVRGDDRVYYSISMNGNPIGYSAIDSEIVKRDGQELVRLSSETSFKFALAGKPRNVLLESETLLNPHSGKPVHYRLTNTTNESVQRVDCEFSDGLARTWKYRQGDDRGKSVETELSDDTMLLGGNNFGHWQWLAKSALAASAKATVRIPVFVPETGQVETFELVRGEAASKEIGGTSRLCTPWRLEQEDLTIFVDAESRQFLGMDLPAQRTAITLADQVAVKLARKAQVEEVLARHFVQSNVLFDNYLKVDVLVAEVDVQVIGSGVANDATVLITSMQEFNGKKDRARVTGTVTVRKRRYQGQNAPPFPGEPEVQFDRWLKPEPYIECDHPEIVARSAELTRGAPNRWEATLRIARWVEKEIRYTLADTPSARLALEKREGDCGPHSTLTIAMARAAGIPARLVGGVLYTPTFGGSFGQHAWVEVHMGPSGWVALDPTTGEYEELSATHIKLFEGMGGVLPKSIRVVTFEPPNRPAVAATPTKAKPLPWEFGKKYTYSYKQAGTEIGVETFVVKKVELDGKDAYEVHADVELKAGGVVLKGPTTLAVTPAAQPLSFRRDLDAAGQKYTIECVFREGKVDAKISGAKNLTQEIKVPAGVYCFDNNLMSCFAVICSQLTFEAEKELEVRTFHPSTLQIIPLTFKPKAPSRVEIGGKEIECYECEVLPIKNTFWITRDGRFVKAQQGNVVIELVDSKE